VRAKFQEADWVWTLVRQLRGGSGPSTSNFIVFNKNAEVLDFRQQRLKTNRISVQADLLNEAHPHGFWPSFESIMQADFVAFLRTYDGQKWEWWYPLSLVYALGRFAPFPIFARSESTRFANQLMPLLGMATTDDFKKRIAEIDASPNISRLFSYRGLPVAQLANSEHLATRP
jgi:hypothetical protein